MTPPAGAGRRLPGSRRVRAAVLALIVAVGVALVAAAGFEHTLTYYDTPSDVMAHPPAAGQSFRLEGMVMRGSIQQHGVTVSFTVTDGAHDLHVVSSQTPPSTFRPGQDTVVTGWLSTNGVFHATSVMVRHSNQYQPAGSRS
jgi:cytochrome c-type biogenesis protein CcmE